MGAVDKHKEVFLEEANELLAELETSLLELEDRPDDKNLIGRAFRAMHTIKGSGSMFGYDVIAKFTHELETAFDLVRSGKAPMTRDLVSISLSARDLIKAMLDSPDSGAGPAHRDNADEILSRLRLALPSRAGDERKPASQKSPAAEDAHTGERVTYRIRFRPPKEIFRTGINPANILKDVASLGDCTVVAATDAVPFIDDLDPELCYVSWDVILTTDRGRNAVEDAFIFVQEDSEIKIEEIGAAEDADAAAGRKFGEILVDRGDVTPDVIERALTKQKRLGDILQENGAVEANKVESALAEQRHVREVCEKKQKEDAMMSVRVPAEKLDRLVDLVGELVTVQARLSQMALREKTPGFLSISEEVDRLTADLRDNAMSVRMMPIGGTFSRFRRLVRDLSRELGKEAELLTDGAETELDKTVIERLSDPLVHLIRNSIDHGIEPPDVRAAAGKPAKGTVLLRAEHSGANVLIRITDDGKGLDPEAIRTKAVEKGMLNPEARPSEKELFSLIFAAGFSTAKTVTSVSGRGVGMDVVRKAIDGLRGSVEIESAKGKGTTITLKLPLTLAIIDGFLTEVAGAHYVFPLALVEECVELSEKQRREANGRSLALVRGELVPYVRLREHFRVGDEPPEIEQIVITRMQSGRVGFVVDRVIGGHQTVIKNLGRFYREAEGLSGATILGDGTVALILDAPRLARDAEKEEITA